MKRYYVIGAGGCAREVAWTIRDAGAVSGEFEFAGYVVTDHAKSGPHDSVDEIVGDLEWLVENRGIVDGVVMGIGSPATRASAYREVETKLRGLFWPVIIHPSVAIDRPSAKLESGVVICAAVVATVNVRLARNVLIHYGSTVSHEVQIGEDSVVNPAASLSGGVRVGSRSLIGVGARVLQYLQVGDDAIVGAGAVVNRDVSPGATVVGVPARPIK